eukprot:TRINITY_DN5795_c0_g1_i1.p1 TRINITY_DN5795_c0_g1~~TRINITY_DN5795_c0_g1_i1.p1  ORF type:complete len:458 (+),score=143.57 TRINITY_DN5795_c0_g1_i1:209-1582(+)
MDPDQFISYKYRAQMHEKKGELKEALRFWGEAIRSEPTIPNLYVSRAQLLKQMDNHEEAVKDLEKAHELDLEDGKISRLLKIFRTELKLTKTEEELTKGIGEDSSYWEAYYNRGTFYHRSGKKKEALADYEKALASKASKDIWFKKGLILYEMERYEDAIKDFDDAISGGDKDWKIYSTRGKCFGALNKNEEAVKDFTKVIELCSEERYKAEAYHDRGNAYKSIEKYKEALEDMSEAIRLSPEADHYFGRGNVYSSLHKYEEAEADFTKAISIEANHWNAYRMRALSYFRMKQKEKGIQDLTSILESNENPQIYYSRGVAYAGMGASSIDNVISDMTKAIELAPDLAGAYQMRGVAYNTIGKVKEAIADLTSAIKCAPQERVFYEIRSNIYIAQNDFKLAIDDISKLIELHPTSAKLYLQRAHLYDKLGDTGRFAEDYRKGSLIKTKKKLLRGQQAK